jgi:uncharacterized protein (TIGR00730 family)
MRVCVFCGSSDGVAQYYADAARRTATLLAENDIAVVYGGASVGLMGMVADAALAAGGEVFGVVPESLTELEIAHGGLTRLEVVDTMTVRKDRMLELSDAFVSLPGGIGTLDELFEVWTLQALDYQDKPFAILNTAGYYDALIALLDHMVTEGFLRQAWRDQLHVADTPEELLEWVISQ